jgi:hypothetical protein
MILAAMSRWQPMASMVTTAPSIAIMSSRAGMATISFDFSLTLVCASTRRCRAAKAETIWIGALDFVLAPDRRTVLPSMAMTSTAVLVSAGDPIDKAALERLSVQRGEDIAQRVMRRRPIHKGQKPTQQIQLLLPKPRDACEAIRAGKHRKQRKKQHLVKRIDNLPSLPGIRQSTEITQKRRRLGNQAKIRPRHPVHRRPPRESVGSD